MRRSLKTLPVLCAVLLMLLGVWAVTFTLYYSDAGNPHKDGSTNTIEDHNEAKSGDVYAIVPPDTCPSGSFAYADFEHYSTTHHPSTTGYYDVDYNFEIEADIGKEQAGDTAYVRVLCFIQQLIGAAWSDVAWEEMYFYDDVDGDRTIQFDDAYVHNYYTYRVRVVNIARADISADYNYAKADAGWSQGSYEVEFNNAEFTYDHG